MATDIRVGLHNCYNLADSIISFVGVNIGLYAFTLIHSYYYAIGFAFPIIGVVSAIRYHMRGLYVYTIFLGTDLTLQWVYLIKYHKLWNYLLCFTTTYSNCLNICLIYRLDKRIAEINERQLDELRRGWTPSLLCTSWGHMYEPLVQEPPYDEV